MREIKEVNISFGFIKILIVLMLSLPLLHQLVKVFLHVFKHKVEGVVLPDNLEKRLQLSSGSKTVFPTSFSLITLACDSFFRLFTSLRFIASSQE